MASTTRLARLDAWLGVLAALVGTLPPALLAAVCLARFLPFSEALRFSVGVTLAIPLWVGAMCTLLLARSAGRAWGLCLLACVVLGSLAYAVPL